jgi:hypothetical protein
MSDRTTPQKCTATTRQGRPCQAWAVRGSSPPRCASHGGRPDEGGGERPPGPQDAPDDPQPLAPFPGYVEPEQGPVEIAAVIRDLGAKQQILSDLIDRCLAEGDPPTGDLARLLTLHSQNAARLGRLLRDQQALGDPAATLMVEAINAALDELSEEWGVEL